MICAIGSNADDERHLAAFNAMHGTQIQLTPIEGSNLVALASNRFGPAAVMRLRLNEYLSPVYDRVLYIDSDCLVLGPIRELLECDLDAHPVGAVQSLSVLELFSPRKAGYLKSIGLDPALPYLNSGMLLFDWPVVLERQILLRANEVLSGAGMLAWPDQDALNLVLKQDWKKLGQRWNFMSSIGKRLPGHGTIEIGIRHFNSRWKPWSSACHLSDWKYRSYYTENLSGSGWESFVERPAFAKLLRRVITGLKKRQLVPRITGGISGKLFG